MNQTDSVYQAPMPKFWLGKFNMTNEAQKLNMEDVLIALRRHHNGDWGEVCAEDKEANETALQTGGRLLSVYHDRKGLKYWIITEADRNTTTVLLPDDY